jgi:hypothetical protein
MSILVLKGHMSTISRLLRRYLSRNCFIIDSFAWHLAHLILRVAFSTLTQSHGIETVEDFGEATRVHELSDLHQNEVGRMQTRKRMM